MAGYNEANTDEYQRSSKVIPEGRYSFNVEKIELKLSSADKKYINLHLRVINGNKEGCVVFQPIYASSDYENHSNQKWAQQQFNQLKRLFLVSGVTVPTDSPTASQLQTLKDTHVDGDVVIEEGEGQYLDKNKVQEFYPCSFKQPVETENPAIEEDYDDGDIPF